jgi:uncharacterized glyoxalase superfamily protein PhnB
MKIQTLTPMLRTWDIPATVEFYTTVLGFVCDNRTQEWAALRRDGVSIMLSGPNHHERDQKPSFTGSLYFRIDDVDQLWEAVKDRAKVCYPIETFSYGMREFAIYDNNGYLLQFGEPTPSLEK